MPKRRPEKDAKTVPSPGRTDQTRPDPEAHQDDAKGAPRAKTEKRQMLKNKAPERNAYAQNNETHSEPRVKIAFLSKTNQQMLEKTTDTAGTHRFAKKKPRTMQGHTVLWPKQA